jgi:hypothetical protein
VVPRASGNLRERPEKRHLGHPFGHSRAFVDLIVIHTRGTGSPPGGPSGHRQGCRLLTMTSSVRQPRAGIRAAVGRDPTQNRIADKQSIGGSGPSEGAGSLPI